MTRFRGFRNFTGLLVAAGLLAALMLSAGSLSPSLADHKGKPHGKPGGGALGPVQLGRTGNPGGGFGTRTED